mgnify:CR=1 FL=1
MAEEASQTFGDHFPFLKAHPETYIDDLNLKTLAHEKLKQHSITQFGDLVDIGEADILGLGGVGDKTLEQLLEALDSYKAPEVPKPEPEPDPAPAQPNLWDSLVSVFTGENRINVELPGVKATVDKDGVALDLDHKGVAFGFAISPKGAVKISTGSAKLEFELDPAKARPPAPSKEQPPE